MPNIGQDQVENRTRALSATAPDGTVYSFRYRPWVWTTAYALRADKARPWETFPDIIEWWDLTVCANVLAWMDKRIQLEEQLAALRAEYQIANDERREAILQECEPILKEQNETQDPPYPDMASGEVPFPISSGHIKFLKNHIVNPISQRLLEDQFPNSETDAG